MAKMLYWRLQKKTIFMIITNDYRDDVIKIIIVNMIFIL